MEKFEVLSAVFQIGSPEWRAIELAARCREGRRALRALRKAVLATYGGAGRGRSAWARAMKAVRLAAQHRQTFLRASGGPQARTAHQIGVRTADRCRALVAGSIPTGPIFERKANHYEYLI